MKIAIVGSGGRLGAALMREYGRRFDVTGFDHSQLDVADLSQVHAKIDNLDFNVLINAAALTDVDLCEKKRDLAFAINAEAPRVLAEICRDKKAKLIHFSTDYVFDGEKREPYLESDPAGPISVYAESKREGEKRMLQTGKRHLVVRVSWVFGPDRPSFIDNMIGRARDNEQIAAVADKFSTPTYTRDIAQMLRQFFISSDPSYSIDRSYNGRDYSGILHFANAGECSWQEYAQFALDCCRSLGIPLKAKTVGAIKLADMKSWVARRPVYSVLSTEKFFSLTGTTPRNWRDAVAEHVREHYAAPT